MNKNMKKIVVGLLIATTLFTGNVASSQKVNAWYGTKSSGVNWSNVFGITVASYTFYAQGDSTSSSGRVDNMYSSNWAWWPNYYSNESMWKSNIWNGQRANCSITINAGVSTAWASINLKSEKRYFSLDF